MKPLLLCVVLIGLTMCSSTSTLPPTVIGLHLVVDVQGQMQVQRVGWNAYAPALLGTTLQSGDLLRVDDGSVATVVCADLTLVKVLPGIGAVPCNVAMPILTYKGSPVTNTRVASSEFPIILAPRSTALLDPHPKLRWTSVQGAATYEVYVSGVNLNWHTTVNSATEVDYPLDAPPLVVEKTYKVEVTVDAGTSSSSEEGGVGLGFQILPLDKAEAVGAAELKLLALDLPNIPTRLLIANLYGSNGLVAEAIEQLEEISSTSQQPAISRTLGQLYQQIGLNRLAEEHYLQALKLSEQTLDTEGQALTQHLLGQIYPVLGNSDEAVRQLEQAIQNYQKVGATKTIAEIETLLAGLRQP